MSNQRTPLGRGGLLAGAVAVLLVSAALAAPGPAGQVEGTISAVGMGTVTIITGAGAEIRTAVTADTRVIQRRSVRLEDIRPNDLVGVTARREADGSLTAISINIFPAEFRGRVREAQFIMDTGNVMTNATVFQNVRRIEGRMLYLRLPDGTAVIAVPAHAEVFRLAVMQTGDLKPGMLVQVRGTADADGSLAAATITVVVP